MPTPPFSHRAIINLALIVVILSCAAVSGRASAAADISGMDANAESRQLIVGFKHPQSSGAARGFLNRYAKVALRAEIPAINAIVVDVPSEQLEARMLEMAAASEVGYVERDGEIQATFDPNDPAYATNQWGPQAIQANQAWDSGTGDPGIIVAIVDSGVSLTHPDLAGRCVPGFDFMNSDADPTDDFGHGTHVAGIVAAQVNNQVGIAGIAGNTSLMPVKVLGATGGGSFSRAAQGIIWAVDHGAKVISLSFGATIGTTTMQNALQYAWDHGALVVAASGNNANDQPFYPAWYPVVVSVSGLASASSLATYSSFGPEVDLAAPGSSIYSTCWSAGGGDGYCNNSGTSMAAPHVAGAAALVWARNPSLTNAQVRAILESSADEIGDSYYYGHGRVNVAAAVAAAGSGTPVPTPEPTVVAPSATPAPTATATALPSATPVPSPTATQAPSPTVTPAPTTPACTAKCLRSIKVVGSASKRGSSVAVSVDSTVKDELDNVVAAGTTVYATWSLPNGLTQSQVAQTNRKGIATFGLTGDRGQYVFTITNIVRNDYTFDPANSILRSEIVP